jgi:hypothetical protein
MAQTSALMHTGLAAAVARQLGSSDPGFTLAPTGTTQATAVQLPGSLGFIFPVAATTPAPGVRLPPASGAAQTVLYNADAANPVNVYPAAGEILNSWAANVPLKIAAGGAVIATPGRAATPGAPNSWICVVQVAPATQGP